MITRDGGEDGWTPVDDMGTGSDAGRAAEVDMLYRGVDALRDAVPEEHREHGTLEFALLGVSRVLEEAARSTSSGEDVPVGLYQAALDVARHLEHYGAETEATTDRSR